LEAETSSLDAIQVVENNVQRKLLTTYAVGLAAFTFDLYVNELLHLRVKIKQSRLFTAASLSPDTTFGDKVLVG
jgi:hypothetical protein